MVSINLLPVKKILKRQRAIRDVIILAVILVLVQIGLGGVALVKNSQEKNLRGEIVALTNERDSYKSTLAEIEKLKLDKQNLETKLAVIGNLKKNSRFVVKIMDEVANLVPANRVWLSSLGISQSSLTITAVALDNDTIAQFMDVIDKSPYFADPELDSSILNAYEGLDVRSFGLKCQVTWQTEEVAPAEQKSS